MNRNITMNDSYYSDSDNEYEYEMCTRRPNACGLPFDASSLEDIILTICDSFDFRVIMNSERAKGALLVTTGLTLAGGIIGRHYGGKIGAAMGGAIGGACGLGIAAISMRELWDDVKDKLQELLEIVFDYLAGLGLDDYKRAAMLLAGTSGGNTQLAMIILETTSSILGKKVLSSLTAA